MQKLTARRLYGIGVVLFVSALPLKVGGCGDTACFTVTNDQLTNGQCPSIQMAQARFMGNGCPTNNSITVKGNGELDGTLCCYPVDQQDQQNFEAPCPIQGGIGGDSSSVGDNGAGAGGPGVGPGGTFAAGVTATVAVGVTSSATGGPCATCSQVLNGSASSSALCGGNAVIAFKELASCACTGVCANACQANLCDSSPTTPFCVSCLASAMGGCGGQLMSCEGN